MKVSVIIPNYNGEKVLPECLEALKKQVFQEFEVILVDNGSADESISLAEAIYPGIRIISLKKNTGFASAVNVGIKNAQGEFVILLNNDTIPFSGFVGNQYKMIKNKPKVFSCSALMIRNDKRELVDDAGDAMCMLGWAFAPGKDKPVADYGIPREIFAACGGAAIYRKSVLEQIGMFDNSFFAYLEDMDLGYRALLHGYHNLYNPHARVYHIGSASSGSRHNEFKVHLAARNSMYLFRKNMPAWQLVLNFPFLYLGVLIKLAYFWKKGLAQAYVNGILEGIDSHEKIEKTVMTKDFDACIKMQVRLFRGLFLLKL